MRTLRLTPLTVPAVLAGVLALAACDTEGAGAPRAGGPSCGPETAAAGGTDPAGGEGTGDVDIVGSDVASPACAPAIRITSHERQPFTYTVTLSFLSDSGAAMMNTEQTVPAVGPGRTVRRPVDLAAADATDAAGANSGPGAGTLQHIRVLKVRSVPADEAPVPSGPCPPSGVRVTADRGDAAMGLRVVGLHLENCSAAPYHLDGYPQLQLLDEGHRPVTGIKIRHGGSGSVGPEFDAPPRPLSLQPGETASSGLTWRNTVTYGTPVDAPYVRVRARPGADPVMVTPELDLGTTGKLGVSAWHKSEADTAR
ncbi:MULTISPECIES: DUF4232 domain-containing protein [unclassified Streptomyces]|uniref:DUF4232 domain-containing protein n=1 Tax=unclassified Streptomyces TaxID=2593676 RepID=UPI003816642B